MWCGVDAMLGRSWHLRGRAQPQPCVAARPVDAGHKFRSLAKAASANRRPLILYAMDRTCHLACLCCFSLTKYMNENEFCNNKSMISLRDV